MGYILKVTLFNKEYCAIGIPLEEFWIGGIMGISIFQFSSIPLFQSFIIIKNMPSQIIQYLK